MKRTLLTVITAANLVVIMAGVASSFILDPSLLSLSYIIVGIFANLAVFTIHVSGDKPFELTIRLPKMSFSFSRSKKR
jgi:phage shock protein PspC (stress-responsive transcriptional regulator)